MLPHVALQGSLLRFTEMFQPLSSHQSLSHAVDITSNEPTGIRIQGVEGGNNEIENNVNLSFDNP